MTYVEEILSEIKGVKNGWDDRFGRLESDINGLYDRQRRSLALGGAVAAASEKAANEAGRFFMNVGCALRNAPLQFGHKAYTPVQDPAGGFVVPDTMVPEIIRIAKDIGALQQLARSVPLGRGKTRIPKRGGAGITAFWVAAGGTITGSQSTLAQVVMEPEKLAALVVLDNELDDEAVVDIGQFVIDEMAYGFAKEEERCLISGTGAPGDGGIVGLLNTPNVTDVTMGDADTGFDDLDWEDLVDLECAVVNASLSQSRYVLSRSILGLIKKLKGTDGHPVWMPAAGGEPSLINGYPYTIVDAMPSLADSAAATRFLAFGDFRQGLYIGRRRNFRVEKSTEFYFPTDQTGYRAIESIDAEWVSGSESGQNPIACLKTAAGG